MAAIERTLIIGRGQKCDVVLADESVSRKHAELKVSADGSIQITDLGSTHGTAVLRRGRATPVSRTVVTAADVLRFGDVDLSVAELLAAAPQRPPPGLPDEGGKLVRCGCGAIKPKGQACPECGR